MTRVRLTGTLPQTKKIDQLTLIPDNKDPHHERTVFIKNGANKMFFFTIPRRFDPEEWFVQNDIKSIVQEDLGAGVCWDDVDEFERVDTPEDGWLDPDCLGYCDVCRIALFPDMDKHYCDTRDGWFCSDHFPGPFDDGDCDGCRDSDVE